MRLFRIVGFVLASVLEVQVHASSYITLPEAKSPVELPENCILENPVCTIRTVGNEKYSIDVEGSTIVMGPNSVFARTSSHSGSIIWGHAWVKSHSKFTIETPYGAITVSKGEAMIRHLSDKIVVQTLAGETTLFPRGMEKPIVVLSGFENWIGRVTTKGQSAVGIPKPLDIKSVVLDLAPLQTEGRSVFESRLRDLREKWSGAIGVASDHYSLMVQRELASQEERRRQREKAEKRWQEERAQWRKLLWEKTFE